MDAGEVVTIKAVLTIPEGATVVDVSGGISSSAGDSALNGQGALQAVKSTKLLEDPGGNSVPEPGDRIEFTITITNVTQDKVGGVDFSGYINLQAVNQEQYPLNITTSKRDGSYRAQSGASLPPDLSVLGYPKFAIHPAFTFPARKIFFRDRELGGSPGSGLPDRMLERDFGFWFVDPNGGIGTSKPPGLGLDLIDVKVRDARGKSKPAVADQFKNLGKIPVEHTAELTWRVGDDYSLQHVQQILLNGGLIQGDWIVDETKKTKDLKALIPPQPVGGNQIQVMVRNQYGFELFANLAFLVTTVDGGSVLQPTGEPPAIVEAGVSPKPAESEVIEEGDGLLFIGDIIYIPFSEPVSLASLNTFRSQLSFEVTPLGKQEWEPWPISLKNATTLEDLSEQGSFEAFFVEPVGNLPDGHIFRLTVSAGDGVKDTGFEGDEPQGLPARSKYGAGIHYQAKWVSPESSIKLSEFTENATVA